MNPILRHFGLPRQPFSLTPDIGFYFPWHHAQNILHSLEFSIQRGDGLLRVGGLVGSGKTLLCHLLLTRLDQIGVNTAYLNAPVTDAEQLTTIVAREFGIGQVDISEPYRCLGAFLLDQFAAGRRNVLVIDEAQALGPKGLEHIRLLSNLETGAHKLLQIVMFGQPELAALLARQDMQQITQRIAFHFSTKLIPPGLVGDYIRYRLARCTSYETAPDLFDHDALSLIGAASKGSPRLINILADKGMIAAYAQSRRRVTRAHIRAAIHDTPHLPLFIPLLDRVMGWRRSAT